MEFTFEISFVDDRYANAGSFTRYRTVIKSYSGKDRIEAYWKAFEEFSEEEDLTIE